MKSSRNNIGGIVGEKIRNLWITEWKRDGGTPFDCDNPYRVGYVEIGNLGYLNFCASNPTLIDALPGSLLIHENSAEIVGAEIAGVSGQKDVK